MDRVLTALVIATAALSSATVAAADDAAPDANATVSTISQAAGLGPGDTAPLDFPGVRTIRRGKRRSRRTTPCTPSTSRPRRAVSRPRRSTAPCARRAAC